MGAARALIVAIGRQRAESEFAFRIIVSQFASDELRHPVR
jgi:hypothetical protein